MGSERISIRPGFNKITDLKYVDAETGQVREIVTMREFYEWNNKFNQYQMIRHYELNREKELNPKGDRL